MNKIIFYGEVLNGKLTLKNQSNFNKYLTSLSGEIQLTIERKKKRRSLNMNSLYWWYITIISDETGDNVNSLHEYFKKELLPPRFETVLGKEVELPPSTAVLDSYEFSQYLSKIEALSGVPIPETY